MLLYAEVVALPTPLPSELVELITARFKLLSEPMRIRILDQLREGEQSVGGLAEVLDTSQQNVSKHLQALYAGGAVARRKDGNTVFYEIADESLLAMCEAVCDGVEQRISELSRIVAGI